MVAHNPSPLSSEQRQALADRWEEIDGGLEALAAKRDQLGETAYNERRDELLGEIDEIEYELGVDWLERRNAE